MSADLNESYELEPTPELIKACIAALAQKDRAFKEALLSNPRAAVETALGEALPAQIKINVVQEGPDTYTVVLPYETQVGADGELSDGDLESVAGGSKAGADAFAKQFGGALLGKATGGNVTLDPAGGLKLSFDPTGHGLMPIMGTILGSKRP